MSDLIIKHYHNKVVHGGHGFTLNEVRRAGYWIAGANSPVKKVILSCIAALITRKSNLSSKKAETGFDSTRACFPIGPF